MSPYPNSTGSPKTTAAGIVSLLIGILGLVSQVMAASNGQKVDVTSGLGSVVAITNGVGLVKAQDAKPKF